MKKKMIMTLALCLSIAIFASGCGDASNAKISDDSSVASSEASEGSTSEGGTAEDGAASEGGTAESGAASEDGTAEGGATSEGGSAATTEGETSRETTGGIKYNVESPWEAFDMYGLPERLDLRKKDDGDVLVLVNKLHAVSKKYMPTDMVAIDGKYTTNQGLEMKADAYKAFKKMRKAAKADGVSFKICSAYRSYETQKWLYQNYLSTMGKELRDIRSAAPGRSEHHTGYAIDITAKSMGWTLSQEFANTSEGKWIKKNCAEYGFIIRYPKGKTDITGYDYEPWHLRYVGVDVAKEITEKDVTLEEYLRR